LTTPNSSVQTYEKPADVVSVDDLRSTELPRTMSPNIRDAEYGAGGEEKSVPLLDPIVAQQMEAYRFATAGPRSSSLDEVIHAYVPWVSETQPERRDSAALLRQTVRVHADGTVERGIEVPHEASNLQCNAHLGTRSDFDTGITYDLRCKKRSGHVYGPHTPVDTRILAATPKRAKGQRFAPSGIPGGVDQSITLPHNCENHLKDVEEVERGYR